MPRMAKNPLALPLPDASPGWPGSEHPLPAPPSLVRALDLPSPQALSKGQSGQWAHRVLTVLPALRHGAKVPG